MKIARCNLALMHGLEVAGEPQACGKVRWYPTKARFSKRPGRLPSVLAIHPSTPSMVSFGSVSSISLQQWPALFCDRFLTTALVQTATCNGLEFQLLIRVCCWRE